MRIKVKIFTIIFLLIIISFSNIYAANVVVNESNEISNPAPSVTYSSSSNTTLGISDIIDIILISVCVVLIFLAIAILIRCK